MFPLSFDEFLEFRKDSGEDIHKSFDAFLRFGGLPGLHELQASPRATAQYLNDVFNSVLLKDVVSRNNIRDTELLNRIIQFIFDNVGSTFSAKNISDFLKSQGRKLGVETTYNYLDYLENAFVIERVKRFDLKGKKYLETQEKDLRCRRGDQKFCSRVSTVGYRRHLREPPLPQSATKRFSSLRRKDGNIRSGLCGLKGRGGSLCSSLLPINTGKFRARNSTAQADQRQLPETRTHFVRFDDRRH